jgi:uncharacterized protein YcbX
MPTPAADGETAAMRVTRLFRYPVKSLQGEALDESQVGELGLLGDRQFGVLDLTTGAVLTGRREPAVLMAAGRLSTDGSEQVEIVLPDGRVSTGDADLSDWLGRPVRLVAAATHGPGTHETTVDPEDEDSQWISWTGPAGVFHDADRARVSIIAEGEMRDWDIRRFRPNVVVSGETVAGLVGKQVALGPLQLEVRGPLVRCVMVTRAQPGGIERDLSVLKTINRELDMLLGIGTTVTRGGTLRVGDELTILD